MLPGFEEKEIDVAALAAAETAEDVFRLLTGIETNRSCGTCDACCTTMGVSELQKEHHERCGFLCPEGGCQIYGQHPDSCRFWSCGWKMGVMKDFQRPDAVGFVLCAIPAEMVVHGRPAMMMGYTARMNSHADLYAWKEESALRELQMLSCSGMVVVGFRENVYAAIWMGQVFELTPEQRDEINKKGHLYVAPGVMVTHDPKRRW